MCVCGGGGGGGICVCVCVCVWGGICVCVCVCVWGGGICVCVCVCVCVVCVMYDTDKCLTHLKSLWFLCVCGGGGGEGGLSFRIGDGEKGLGGGGMEVVEEGDYIPIATLSPPE